MDIHDATKALTLFLRQMDIIRELGMVNRPIPAVSLHVSISAKNGLTSRVDNLDIDKFRSLLLGVRQFLNQNDPINFNTVCNILEQIGIDPKNLAWARAARKNWKRVLQSCPSHYRLSDKILTVEYSFKLYFYGVLFHSDPEIAAEWDELPVDFQNAAIYSIRTALPALCWSLSTVDTIIDTILNHPEREIPDLPACSS